MTFHSINKLICLLAFLIVFSLGAYWTQMNKQLFENEQRLLLKDIVSAQASAIERSLSRSLSATYTLAYELHNNGGVFDDFEAYAAKILATTGGVTNLQLAPDGIVQKIYPLKGHEKAIGHNILRDDARKKEAQAAVNADRLTLAGPFELIQGGVAIIGRNPVFLEQQGEQVFWGFVSALIMLEDLLSATELDQLGGKGYSYELMRRHPDTGIPDIFASSIGKIAANYQSAVINVPNAQWTLTMSRPDKGLSWSEILGYSASAVIAAFAAWFLYFVLRQPEKLRVVVKQKTLELETLAFYDHLTGLANGKLLAEQVTQIIHQATRYQTPAAFLYLDLDDFKRINDSLGHEAGDIVLKQVAQRLSMVVRDSDIAARLGGDEFCVVLFNAVSVGNVGRTAQKLIHEIEKPILVNNREFVISTSIGITMIPDDGNEFSALLKHADLAMYAAKGAGKRGYRFFDPAMQISAHENMCMEEELVVAVNSGQFILYYQPLLDLQQGTITSYEALIRWHHPERGLLYPDRFISLAEDTGKIIQIGYWVVRQACEMIKSGVLGGCATSRIAVNLSPRQFSDPELLNQIRLIILEVGIDPSNLEIEITESTLMDDVEAAIQTVDHLKAMGITIAIDDFGTGYSSLSFLKRFSVDKLKIDQSFVQMLATDSDDQKIVEGIIALAHKLQISVIAEGIEIQEQLQLLKSYQCDYGQGYLFSRPVPSESIDKDKLEANALLLIDPDREMV